MLSVSRCVFIRLTTHILQDKQGDTNVALACLPPVLLSIGQIERHLETNVGRQTSRRRQTYVQTGGMGQRQRETQGGRQTAARNADYKQSDRGTEPDESVGKHKRDMRRETHTEGIGRTEPTRHRSA